MTTLIGVDVGTSGTRALAVTDEGELVAEANRPHDLLSPQPGWTEQDPAQWSGGDRPCWPRSPRKSTTSRASGSPARCTARCSSTRRGEVIRPALLWNDQRTAAECDEITERVGAARLLEIAGNPALTGFQAPKIRWLRARASPTTTRAWRSVLLPKDYVRLMLTGEHATDASDASGTLLLDVRARDWAPEILDALEIPREWLPKVYEGPEVTGTLRAGLGLPEGLPVAAGGGDNAAAAVGVGVTREGAVSTSIGTSGVLFAHRDAFSPDPSGRVHAFCHAVPDAWHLMAVALSSGGSLSWWRDRVGADFDTLVAEAEAVPPGSDGLIFLPYLSGERTPHLDPHARGAFVGLTLHHGRGHMTRAVMEGVAFSMRDGLEIMRGLGTPDDDLRAVGGGARSPLWMHLQADVYGRAIRRTVIDEGPAYGAALLGGVAAGVFADVQEASTRVRLREEITEPDGERARRYDELYRIYTGLYPSLRDAMHELAR